MLKSIRRFFSKQIDINSLHEIKFVRYDDWNKKNGGYIYRMYFTEPIDVSEYKINDPNSFHDRYELDELASKSVGFITYKLATGQIGLFFISEEYKNRNFGKKILTKVISDIRNEGKNSVFAITTKNHQFWSNVFGKSFEWRDRPDKSVTGSGYFLSFSSDSNHDFK